jgi:hypothetical protein
MPPASREALLFAPAFPIGPTAVFLLILRSAPGPASTIPEYSYESRHGQAQLDKPLASPQGPSGHSGRTACGV